MEWMTASECADWWGNLFRTNGEKLNRLAENKGYGADTKVGFLIVWGTGSVNTATDMLLLDPLRLGQGSGQASAGGSKWGYLADVGRLTSFIPLGKLPGIASRTLRPGAVAQTALARDIQAVAKGNSAATKFSSEGLSSTSQEGFEQLGKIFKLADPDGNAGICSWVSLYQALRHTGRYFMKLEDLCDMLGITRGPAMWKALQNSTSINELSQLSVILSRLDIAHKRMQLDAFRQMGHGLKSTLESMVSLYHRGALVFGVRWMQNGKEVGHVMYAARDCKGLLRIYDRTGEIVQDLAALETKFPGYAGIANATFKGVDVALWIPDAAIAEKAVNAARATNILSVLLIPLGFKAAAVGTSRRQ